MSRGGDVDGGGVQGRRLAWTYRHDWRWVEGDPNSQRCFLCGMTRRSKRRDKRGQHVWTAGYASVDYLPAEKGAKWFKATYTVPCKARMKRDPGLQGSPR